MSDALEKLKSIGSQQIYIDTHIPTSYVEAILDEEYEKLTRTQFFGFVSIFERDYNIDLQELKSHALEYYDIERVMPLADTTVFVAPLKQKDFTVFYISIALFIFLLALYYRSSVTDGVNKTSAIQTKISPQQSVEKKVIAPTKKISVVLEVNSSKKEQNLTKRIEQKVTKVVKPLKDLEILPRSRVWLGYINVTTNKKRQKTFSNELDLNASKEWIFVFGHGHIDVMVNGIKRHFNNKNSLRLHYKDGVLEKISRDEFEKLNRGRKW